MSFRQLIESVLLENTDEAALKGKLEQHGFKLREGTDNVYHHPDHPTSSINLMASTTHERLQKHFDKFGIKPQSPKVSLTKSHSPHEHLHNAGFRLKAGSSNVYHHPDVPRSQVIIHGNESPSHIQSIIDDHHTMAKNQYAKESAAHSEIKKHMANHGFVTNNKTTLGAKMNPVYVHKNDTHAPKGEGVSHNAILDEHMKTGENIKSIVDRHVEAHKAKNRDISSFNAGSHKITADSISENLGVPHEVAHATIQSLRAKHGDNLESLNKHTIAHEMTGHVLNHGVAHFAKEHGLLRISNEKGHTLKYSASDDGERVSIHSHDGKHLGDVELHGKNVTDALTRLAVSEHHNSNSYGDSHNELASKSHVSNLQQHTKMVEQGDVEAYDKNNYTNSITDKGVQDFLSRKKAHSDLRSHMGSSLMPLVNDSHINKVANSKTHEERMQHINDITREVIKKENTHDTKPPQNIHSESNPTHKKALQSARVSHSDVVQSLHQRGQGSKLYALGQKDGLGRPTTGAVKAQEIVQNEINQHHATAIDSDSRDAHNAVLDSPNLSNDNLTKLANKKTLDSSTVHKILEHHNLTHEHVKALLSNGHLQRGHELYFKHKMSS